MIGLWKIGLAEKTGGWRETYTVYIYLDLIVFSNAHQGCIYLMKNTVKQEYL